MNLTLKPSSSEACRNTAFLWCLLRSSSHRTSSWPRNCSILALPGCWARTSPRPSWGRGVKLMRACDDLGLGIYVAIYGANLQLWVTESVSGEISARYVIITQTRPVNVPSLRNKGNIFIQGIHPRSRENECDALPLVTLLLWNFSTKQTTHNAQL